MNRPMIALSAALALSGVIAQSTARPAEGLSVRAETWRGGRDAYFAVDVSGPIAGKGRVTRLSLPGNTAFLIYRKRVGPETYRHLGRLTGDWPGMLTISSAGRDEVKLTGIEAARGQPSLADEWAELRMKYLDKLAERLAGNSFVAYQVASLSGKHGLPLPKIRGTRGAGRSAVELIEITAGELAFNASLEAGAAGSRAVHRGPQSFRIPAAGLEGPAITPLDYSRFADAKGGELPEPFGMVPSRCAAVRVHRVSKALELSDLVGGLVSLLVQASGWGSRRSDVGDLTMQLGFEASDALRTVYPLAVGDVTIVFGDFYFPEGAEFAMILKVKNAKLFDNRIQASRRGLAERLPGTAEEILHHAGAEIELLRSPDERLRSYYASVGDYAVFTNTAALIKDIISASLGGGPSVGKTPEARALWVKTDGDDHDAFGCMPEGFIRRQTSAASKIAELRRIRCGAEMELLGCARGMAILRGLRTEEPAALVGAGLLANEPKCPEGGRYVFDKEAGRYHCTLHLSPGRLERVSERPANKVSSDESRRYSEFVKDFEDRVWGRGACAIAMTIDVGPTLVARIHVPVLPDDGAVGTVRGLFGGEPIDLHLAKGLTPGAAGAVAFKLGPLHAYREDLSHVHPESFREALRRQRDRIQIHLGWDRDGHILSWADDRATYLVADQGSYGGFADSAGLLRVPTRDRMLAVESMATLQRLGAFITPGEFKGIRRLAVKDVVAGPEDNPTVTTVEALDSDAEFHLAFGPLATYIATDRKLLEAALAGERSGERGALSREAKWVVRDLPRRANIAAVVDGAACRRFRRALLEAAERNAAALCAARRTYIRDLWQLWMLGPLGPERPFSIEEACRIIGEVPCVSCPDGGTYSIDGDGEVTCSVHAADQGVEGAIPPPGSPARQLDDVLKAVAVSLELDRTGDSDGATLTLSLVNPDYSFRPFDWAIETFGWGAVVALAAAAVVVLYVLLKIYRRLRHLGASPRPPAPESPAP